MVDGIGGINGGSPTKPLVAPAGKDNNDVSHIRDVRNQGPQSQAVEASKENKPVHAPIANQDTRQDPNAAHPKLSNALERLFFQKIMRRRGDEEEETEKERQSKKRQAREEKERKYRESLGRRGSGSNEST